MKKKKGFTLIELLAVIVILAIIAIIAVPVILNVIEKSKIGAAEQSAQGYVDAVEKQIVTNKVKNENLIEEGEYTKAQLDEKNVKIKGEITDALVVVGEKGRVTQARFCINGYSIDYDGKKATKNSEVDYCNEMNSISDPCLAKVGEESNFEYTGNVQEFTTECEGNYKLEVWGAQGGDASVNGSYLTAGGKGGYSYGEINMNSTQTLYIVVGGQGTASTSITPVSKPGGYNGGGSSQGGDGSYASASGAGATHIATRTGLLSSLSSYKSDILLVAGGGGGSGTSSSYSYAYGGYGGGTTGSNGTNTAYTAGGGGTQSSGGSAGTSSSYSANGSFGQGASQSGGSGGWSGGAGGGGWYGGGSGGAVNAGGGGGSGYVNTSLLTATATVAGNQTFKAPNGTDETGHTGNGYARITYLGK